MRTMLVVAALTVATTATAGRRALIVGTNDGGTDLAPLQFAEEDARRMADVLRTLGKFAPDEVVELRGASMETVRAELRAAAHSLQGDRESLFLFYYSGHADARGLRMGDAVYGYTDLKRDIRAVEAELHLGILDACRAGAITRVKGASVVEPFLLTVPLEAEGEAWIAASSADEDAQESDRIAGSFFTHYLLSALRGAADTGDGFVSLNEAYAYAYDRTVARTTGTDGGVQHPAYEFQLQGTGDLQLTQVSRASSTISFPPSDPGVVSVLREADESPVAEVVVRPGSAVVLAVEPGRYVLRRRVQGDLREQTVVVGPGSSVPASEGWGEAMTVASTAKGEEAYPATGPDRARPRAMRMVNDVGQTFGKLGRAMGKLWPFRRRSAASRSGEGASSPVLEVDAPRGPRLSRQPGVAAALGIVPGAGQLYAGRVPQGLFTMVGTTGFLTSGGLAITRRVTADRANGTASSTVVGVNPLILAGLATWAWGMADGAWGLRKLEDFRPRKGWTVSYDAVWAWDVMLPRLNGLTMDFHPLKGVSIGLDSFGWRLLEPDLNEFSFGGKLSVGPDFRRWRPALFVTVGTRIVLDARGTHEVVEQDFVYGGGAEVRYYLTPRYFVQAQARTEIGGLTTWVGYGGGFGVHFGGGRTRAHQPKRIDVGVKPPGDAAPVPAPVDASPVPPAPPAPPTSPPLPAPEPPIGPDSPE